MPAFKLANGRTIELDFSGDSLIARYYRSPRAQVAEMIRQINAAQYYAGLFPPRPDLVFLDLGANLGFVSLYASPICRRVIALEPEPTTYAMLKTFMARYAPNVECVPAALAGKTGLVPLSIDPLDFSCHTTTNPKPKNPTTIAEAFSFPDIIARHGLTNGIDVCKVDVEGAEMESLTDEVLAAAPVETWYIEVHKTPSSTREASFSEMRSRLQKSGYQIASPRPNALIARR